MSERSNDEKAALHLHRYKGWTDTITKINTELLQMQQQMQQMLEHASNAFLEAREEQEALMAMGLTKDEIEAVAKLPPPATDPLGILRRAKQAKG